MHYLILKVEEVLTAMFNGVKLLNIMDLKDSSEMVMQAMMYKQQQ